VVITTTETKEDILEVTLTKDTKTTDRDITTMVLKLIATIISQAIEVVEATRMITMEHKADNSNNKRRSTTLMKNLKRSLMMIK
jgi:hypothetical protein